MHFENKGTRRGFLRSSCVAGASLLTAGCRPSAGPAISDLAATSSVSTAPRRDNWPGLFGPLRTAISRETGLLEAFPPDGPLLLWSATVGTGYSSPVVANKRLAMHHRQGDLELVDLLDAHTGDLIWRKSFPTGFRCRYEYSNGPYATPILHDDRVLCISAEGVVRSLHRRDGRVAWQRDLRKDFGTPESLFGFGATPLLWRDRLILNAGGADTDSGVIALDADRGTTIWASTDHALCYATPIAARIHDRDFVFVTTFEGLVSIDPNDGKVDWQVPFRPKSPDSVNATSPTIVGDLVLAVTGPGPGAICLRVKPDGGFEERWRDRRALDSQFNTLITVNDHVYGYTSRRQGGAELRCLNVASGDVRWSWTSPLDRGTGLAADGKLILWGEHGHLALLRATTDKPIPLAMTTEPLLSRPCYSAPALADGRLYVRNEDQLNCYQFAANAQSNKQPTKATDET